MRFVPILELPIALQDQVRQLRNQPDVRRFMYTSHEISELEHAGWLQSLALNSRQQVFVILDQQTPVGVVSLNAIDVIQKTADWAFYLDTSLQGKGLGSQVELWLLDHAFGKAGLEKLNCEVLETNPAVIKMHQKFGFSVEGIRRQNIIKDGVRIDVVLLGITAEEWRLQRPRLLPLIERSSAKASK